VKQERFSFILQAAQESGRVTQAELSRALGVSQITIRRDLRELAEKGLLVRARGGAMILRSGPREPSVVQRMIQHRDLKEAIGRAVATLVIDGESIFIGSGSTTAYVCRNLTRRSKLTVVTNALNVGQELATAENITVVVVGGMLRHSELSLIGHITEQDLGEVRVDKAIIGIQAISLVSGLTNDYLPEVMTDRAIIDMAPELILVADHTKFSKIASAYVAPLTRVTTLVTDSQLDEGTLNRIKAMGIKVILAE
jgi:DeoR/GlpR family transcriptional regulator of sugar metabolism